MKWSKTGPEDKLLRELCASGKLRTELQLKTILDAFHSPSHPDYESFSAFRHFKRTQIENKLRSAIKSQLESTETSIDLTGGTELN